MHYSALSSCRYGIRRHGLDTVDVNGVHGHNESTCLGLAVAALQLLGASSLLPFASEQGRPLQGIDGLVHFLAILEKGLLLLDCLVLSNKSFCYFGLSKLLLTILSPPVITEHLVWAPPLMKTVVKCVNE